MEGSNFDGCLLDAGAPPSFGARLLRAARAARAALAGRPGRAFDLLRWFSITSLVALVPAAALTGTLLSHFIAEQALRRDALLTAQFIRDAIGVQAAVLGTRSMNEYLDRRANAAPPGIPHEAVARARAAIYEHLRQLPDVLQSTVYAADRMIVWSSNKALVGSYVRNDEELEEAFATRGEVTRHHRGTDPFRHERWFSVAPSDLFVESYVPLLDGAGEVVAVIEVYKQPGDLMEAIRAGQALVWGTTALGGVLMYLGLFGIIRRADRMLRQQQHQLVDAQFQLFAGEMATALAHSLRNPLSSVRNSAELALCSDDLPVRKNAQDIITQVDFLSQWIRELLLYSRPLSGEQEPVELCAVLDGVLASFAPTLEHLAIRLSWDREPCAGARVQGSTALVRQALHSVISNAVEAMQAGGELRVAMRETKEPAGIELTIGDSGIGMSTQQLAAAFQPFHTTKAQGLGVGLPMVRRAMERFGGSVALSSVENAGTQVRLQFRT
ncbi:MAG TPA: HAMP domain-containing sensor histidine kinase [Ramlibacter sp.]|uniref:sensor histidine kinase n=1 Tax=Ramlibacter sp. TaxID=1917967 RepID=UPI002ED379AF